jgi:uncharacterized protein (TIGR02145 family)
MIVFTGLLIGAALPAQTPEKMSYQAVVRNTAGALITNQNVGIRVQILQASEFGAAVFVETHTRSTNANGLVSLEIGGGSVVLGSFAGINWNNGPYFLKTEIDPAGGTSYSIIGTTQLLSVPYALYSKVAGNGFSGNYNDLINKPVLFDGSWNSLTGKPVFSKVATSGITGSDMIVITNDNNIAISTAGAVNGEVLKYNGTTWTAEPDRDTDTNTTYSAGNGLSLSGTTFSISTSGAVTGEVLKYNGTSWTAEPDWDTNTTYAAGSGLSLSGTTFSLAPGTSAGQMKYWNGTAWVNVPAGATGQILTMVNGVPTWLGTGAGTTDVFNPATGKIWMDRNLGATQVATSSTDANSYGHLYQWGRGTDGHQVRTSGTTTTVSSLNTPGHESFIIVTASPYDWRSPQNDNLWQGVSGVNNPCPAGYRLPTEAEWNAERLSWSTNNAAGAYASPLKLPAAGYRGVSNGSLLDVGAYGDYWSSTVSSTNSRVLGFGSSAAVMSSSYRAYGFSVRCLKD